MLVVGLNSFTVSHFQYASSVICFDHTLHAFYEMFYWFISSYLNFNFDLLREIIIQGVNSECTLATLDK